MELCKVRFDGCHYLVAPYTNVSAFKTEEIIMKSYEELGIDELSKKKDFFINEWANINFPYKNKGRKPIDEKNKKLNDELKNIYTDLRCSDTKYKDNEIVETLYNCITCDYEYVEQYNLNNDLNLSIMNKYIKSFTLKQKENLKNRKALFRRKALNNDWNYFVTFTYDDKKHTEESYLKSLKKKLQNLHTRHGWLYMGCFERSKTDRLHFHGLLFVPQGKMQGNIREESYYDTNAHRKAVSYINEEFEDKIGRNDFKPITKNDITFTNALDYILKYIGKSDNKIVYSRGIKDEFYSLIDEENMICKVNEKSPYYVLGNNKMLELDKNLEIKNLFSENK